MIFHHHRWKMIAQVAVRHLVIQPGFRSRHGKIQVFIDQIDDRLNDQFILSLLNIRKRNPRIIRHHNCSRF